MQPEIYFQPAQILRYLQRTQKSTHQEFEEVVLPWGFKIKIRPDEFIGSHIWLKGVYDICVCETIYRLLDYGENAIDVGSNIGQMTNIMAKKSW